MKILQARAAGPNAAKYLRSLLRVNFGYKKHSEYSKRRESSTLFVAKNLLLWKKTVKIIEARAEAQSSAKHLHSLLLVNLNYKKHSKDIRSQSRRPERSEASTLLVTTKLRL